MIRSFFVTLCLMTSLFVSAQSNLIEEADVYFDFFQYDEAITRYEKSLSKAREGDRPYVYRQLALSYAYSFRYTKSATWFKQLMESGTVLNPEDHLEYGLVLKQNGQYSEAKVQFERYESKSSLPQRWHSRSLDWAVRNENLKKPTQVFLTDLDMNGQCLGYCFFNDGLLYAHSAGKKPVGSMPVFDLDYVSLVDSLHFTKGQNVASTIRFDANEGGPTVSGGDYLCFYANATKLKSDRRQGGRLESSEDLVANFKIYEARLIEGMFGDVRELPFNNAEYNCIHPCLTPDGNALYFASDMPGGYGKLDLYVSKRNSSGQWGRPQNLGSAVNSADNEQFPFISEGRLYFSSKGMNGYGGYDLYTAVLNPGGMPEGTQNMGRPFNSYRDDVALIVYDQGQYGYFSSNRDNEDGTDKVYFFHDYTRALSKAPEEAVAAKPAELKKFFRCNRFAENSANLEGWHKIQLDTLALNASKLPDLIIDIRGYADNKGDENYNRQLSLKRANAVKQYLVGKGVAPARIKETGLGEVIPCKDPANCTEEEKSTRRMVDIRLVAP